MIRKDVIFAILTTFCLCAVMFTVIPIRSQQPYDPWADINDDGKINMFDIGYTAQRFGTSGDSTKNMNVINWPSDYDIQYGTYNMSNSNWHWPLISCGGRSRLSLMINVPQNVSIGASDNVTVFLFALVWRTSDYSSQSIAAGDEFATDDFSFTVSKDGQALSILKVYSTEVKAPYCSLWFGARFPGAPPTDYWITFDYYVYLRNE